MRKIEKTIIEKAINSKIIIKRMKSGNDN